MAYEMVMPYHLHMPSYFLETFTEYPFVMDEFIRYLWLVIVRTMDFLRTNSCVVAQGIEEKDEE